MGLQFFSKSLSPAELGAPQCPRLGPRQWSGEAGTGRAPRQGCLGLPGWLTVFSLAFRCQPVDLIQPANHVLPASFGDSDWYLVTGTSLTSTLGPARSERPPRLGLPKPGVPGDYPPRPAGSPRPTCLSVSLFFSCRSRAAQARAERAFSGPERPPGPGSSAAGGVPPAPTHTPAHTPAPTHIRPLPCRAAPDAAPATRRTPAGA